MIEKGIKEDAKLNLSELWGFSEKYSHQVLVSDMKKNFIRDFNKFLADFLNVDIRFFDASLDEQISAIRERGIHEKTFWLDEIERIKKYSREQAINELIKSRKIHEKLNQIDAYIKNLTL